MSRPAVFGLVLSAAVVVIAVAAAFAARPEGIADKLLEHPNDDPQFFCSAPDPKPVVAANDSDLLLQDCAAGTTHQLALGATLTIDLASGGRLDSAAVYHGLALSDPAILQTVSAPATIAGTREGTPAFDYVATYRGVRGGTVTISALYRTCLNGKCVDTLRWEAVVQVV